MYEVEVKARLRDRESVKRKLVDLGCSFSEELHQVDSIFVPEHAGFPPALSVPVLRVRKQGAQSFLTLKIPQTSRQDCIERELAVADGDMMLDIIRLLRYTQVPTVDKKRIKTNYKDIEIVLDVVEGLGEFVEAEKIVQSTDPADRLKTQDELFVFLTTLGILAEDKIVDGKYDIMLFEKYGMQ